MSTVVAGQITVQHASVTLLVITVLRDVYPRALFPMPSEVGVTLRATWAVAACAHYYFQSVTNLRSRCLLLVLQFRGPVRRLDRQVKFAAFSRNSILLPA